MGRKPFQRQQPNDWFLKNAFYRSYILREFSCIFIGLYVINLMAGVATLAISPIHWAGWLASQFNPVMIILNVLALVSAIYHTVTWFATMPKVIRIPQGDHFMPGKAIILASYAVAAVFTLALLVIAVLL